ncbi:MAG: acetylornithine deacetylase/succinyl-diaminopimelate desuccinylase-like protein [Pseudohongiellaceae bacterium]|jgi:acetylornithine deacetylase/succinyl-diaminopimelate desuccinylase-like protein
MRVTLRQPQIAGDAIVAVRMTRLGDCPMIARPAATLLLCGLALLTPETLAQDAFSVSAPALPGWDRELAASRALRFVSELISINSTNAQQPDPDAERANGNELAVARWFTVEMSEAFGEGAVVEVLAPFTADGGTAGHERRTWNGRFQIDILESAPGRANLIARLIAGAPTSRPVLVMGHMDVVGADPAVWATPPFEATIINGLLHGRGAIDCKGPLACELTAFLALADRRESLTRDVIMLATAGEEGGPSVGIDWVLEHHADLLHDPEFALNEGGRVRLVDGRVQSINIQTTEKLAYNVKATASGPSGHGSVPLPDNALAALSRALAAVHHWRAPASLDETTRTFFARSAELEADPLMAEAMLRVANPAASGLLWEAAVEALSTEPPFNAILRAGQSLTMIDGGFRTNVIPSSGTANFNLRILPQDDVTALVAAMNVAGNELSVHFTLDGEPRSAPPASPLDTDLYLAMEQAGLEMVPDVAVIPFLSTGATDGAALRALGIPTYGILPIPLVMDDELRMHGDNERAPVAGLGWASEYIYRVLSAVTH